MKRLMSFLGGCILLAGCNLPWAASGAPAILPTFAPPTATFTETPPPSPTVTATITPTSTPMPTPTEVWAHQGPGDVIVPVLLYHHIAISPINSRYYIPPDKFEKQLKLLQDWGYTTIDVQLLARAVMEGADLPPRPIVITFDDGNLDNYFNAFPIMQKYGFTGTLYIVGNYLGVDPYMDADQIKEMAAAGWEVGSHGMRHVDLNSLEMKDKRYEIVNSRLILEDKLGIPVLSFSYPFGIWSPGAADYARFAGYVAAMSTDSYGFHQSKYNIFSLERREIESSDDMQRFVGYLPWQGDPADIPEDGN